MRVMKPIASQFVPGEILSSAAKAAIHAPIANNTLGVSMPDLSPGFEFKQMLKNCLF
ncbi:hypothetical protein AQUSIP_25080 [Aquicella siphonis]|uniref:Uncharacterized protein n=1 Tax=Aquicella siphonis TaxID=254247 RepID=A0A5E4PL85_9COXI|nr:hypothetical protein AQUSIP_25080 [Aquicella siphonis]